MLALVYLLFLCAYAQQDRGICKNASDTGLTFQNLLYINFVGPDFVDEMRVLHYILRDTVITQHLSNYTYIEFYDQSAPLIDLDLFTQIWVGDLSSLPDNTPNKIAAFKKIAQWWLDRNELHIICDGRILASLWNVTHAGFAATEGRPNENLMNDYFVNLGVRGGGLMLGTDHAPTYTEGINLINDLLGIEMFYGRAYEAGVWLVDVDIQSPLVTVPLKATHHKPDYNRLWGDSSSSLSPIGLQQNGLIFYPLAWHASKGEYTPSISSTIPGMTGIQINITSPTCITTVASGSLISFKARVLVGTPVNWTWSSDIDGDFGRNQEVTAVLSPGRHFVLLRVSDALRNYGEARIIVNVINYSSDVYCYALAYNKNREVSEYYPIRRTLSPPQYYSYGSPKASRANTPDQLEERRTRAANFFLYQDTNTNNVSLVSIMSEAKSSSAIKLLVEFDSTPTSPTPFLSLTDGPKDRSVTWDPLTGRLIADFRWKGTTKGFILSSLISSASNSSSDRMCVTITVLDLPVNIDYLVVHGHLGKGGADEPITTMQFDAYSGSTLRICYTLCSCASPVLVTSSGGQIAPQSLEFGNIYSFGPSSGILGEKYSDNINCTWQISPSGSAVAGIGFSFNEWAVSPPDAFTLIEGKSASGGIAKIANYSGSSSPGPRVVTGSNAVVMFDPKNDGKSLAGFKLSFSPIPTISKITPSSGPYLLSQIIRMTGTNFLSSSLLSVRVGSALATGVKWVSNTEIDFNIPSQPESFVGKSVPITISNDGVNYNFGGALNYTFTDSDCLQLTPGGCGICLTKSSCAWCNNLGNLDVSYCYDSSTGTCSSSTSDVKIDTTCCSSCNSGGCGCLCNDTCVCEGDTYGPQCSCRHCPSDAKGVVCNGRGTCKCDGTCDCDSGFEGDQCQCTKCGGEPTCSGNGDCQCDGTCACHLGSASSDSRGICDCSANCHPADCSGNGQCICGVCNCLPGYSLLPDCSCKESCDEACAENYVCKCGQCVCPDGFSGSNCSDTTDCSPYSSCNSCVSKKECVWCSGAYKCENKYQISYCDISDKANNPNNFTYTSTCPTAADDSNPVTTNTTGLVVGGIIGGIVAVLVSALVGAIYVANKPVSGPLVDGYE